MTRLGGEFYDVGDDKPTRLEWDARLAFLQAIREHIPSVLSSLHQEVFPRFLEAPPVPRTDGALEALFVTYLLGNEANPPHPSHREFDDLRDSLIAWADSFHLREGWVLETALNTMDRWNYDPRWLGEWGQPPDYLASLEVFWSKRSDQFRFGPDAFEFYGGPWIPLMTQRSDFEDRARKQFEKELASYLDKLEQQAEALGWKRTPKLRQRKTDPQEAYAMLARWQCGGVQTKKQLKRDGGYHLSLDSINERLKQAAAIVGIRLRAGRSGRPRKP